jgi:hypothetical protein
LQFVEQFVDILYANPGEWIQRLVNWQAMSVETSEENTQCQWVCVTEVTALDSKRLLFEQFVRDIVESRKGPLEKDLSAFLNFI